MNNKLMKVMSLNELFKAIEGMASRKAPGNDIISLDDLHAINQ
jgi:hypothetical protein